MKQNRIMTLTDSIRNQSNVLVSHGRSQPKKAAAASWFVRATRTKPAIKIAETRKTGLWRSSPKGRMLS